MFPDVALGRAVVRRTSNCSRKFIRSTRAKLLLAKILTFFDSTQSLDVDLASACERALTSAAAGPPESDQRAFNKLASPERFCWMPRNARISARSHGRFSHEVVRTSDPSGKHQLQKQIHAPCARVEQ